MTDTVYDTESYPNFYLFVCKQVGIPGMLGFEISSRRNDGAALVAYVRTLERMVGFHNVNYDYPLLHYLCHMWKCKFSKMRGEDIAAELFRFGSEIIAAQDKERYKYRIRQHEEIVTQVDLFLINHFDNKAKMTSLKVLEFNMGMRSIEELPIPVGTVLTHEQMDRVIPYCGNDIEATERFYWHSREAIEFRESLGLEFINFNDPKIGKEIFKRELEKAEPGITKKTTIRHSVQLKDIIFPWISFELEPFQRILNLFKDTNLMAGEIDTFFKGTRTHLNKFTFFFGAGGLHGSAPRGVYQSDDENEVLDVDVTSYYPSISIKNRLSPAHLGEFYCIINEMLLQERKKFKKGTANNKALKLSLNGSWGDSGNKYGIFYDIAFMLSVSINGQLLLCKLAEALFNVPDLEIIQANTDGLTVRFPRRHRPLVDEICQWWEVCTQLDLEYVNYNGIWIRDVNNYVARSEAGKMKMKGAYVYRKSDLEWHKNWSKLVVPRAAVANMIDGIDIRMFMHEYAKVDPWSFFLRVKVNRKDALEYDGREVQRLSRYYVSTSGAKLIKIMPPLPGKPDDRRNEVQKNQLVTLANTYDGGPLKDINYDWYVKEAMKLVIN